MKKISFKELSKTQLIILTVVITLLLVIVLPLGIYSAVNHESVGQSVHDFVTPDNKQLVGKWQDEKAITGYEFFEDGTYNYHLSTYPSSKDYETEGNKLILVDYNTNASVVYKYAVNGDTLTLTLISSNGKEPEDKETHKFKRVEHFNLKKPLDVIEEFAKEAVTEKETTTEAE